MKRFGVVLVLALSACSTTSVTTTASLHSEVTDAVVADDSDVPLTTSSTGAVPVAGANGLGDSFYPTLGNGGYDVDHYELELEFDGERLNGTATLTLLATMALESFYLDLSGLDVYLVEIDGQTAEYEVADELLVLPNQPLSEGQVSMVTVEYGGVPGSIDNEAGQFRVGWQESTDGWFALSEPGGADTWFPSNNHPLDKATFSVQITVPEGLVAVSSGELTRVSDDGSTYLWESDSPSAPYLVALAIADFDRSTEVSAGGVPIVNYFDRDLSETDITLFDRQGEMIDFFAGIFGPYPFEEYGALVLETNQTSAALETQTRPTFGTQILVLGESVVAHELAHQWFGDSVSVADWSDAWLNEGFATYGQWLWAEHSDGIDALQSEIVAAYRTLSGASLAAAVTDPRAAYEQASALYPPPGSPAIDDLFGTSVYIRGGLTLHSLRLEVGDEAFFNFLERWATDHRYGNVSTNDFLALVEEIGGQRVVDVVKAWLFSPDLPSISGLDLHPPS